MSLNRGAFSHRFSSPNIDLDEEGGRRKEEGGRGRRRNGGRNEGRRRGEGGEEKEERGRRRGEGGEGKEEARRGEGGGGRRRVIKNVVSQARLSPHMRARKTIKNLGDMSVTQDCHMSATRPHRSMGKTMVGRPMSFQLDLR